MQQQPHQQQDYVQRMANMSLTQAQGAPPAAAQQQQQQPRGGPGSSGGSGRSEGRASARIARSHRAGGAYNPAEVSLKPSLLLFCLQPGRASDARSACPSLMPASLTCLPAPPPLHPFLLLSFCTVRD